MKKGSFCVPVEPEVSCQDTTAVFGEPLNFTCQFFTNPSADYFTLELPNGQIVNGTTNNIALSFVALEVSTFCSRGDWGIGRQ